MVHILSLGSVIFGLWLLLSGHFTPWFFFLGLVSTAVAVFFALRMDVADEEGVPVAHLSLHFLTYLPWLVWEVVKSNVQMARIVLDPKLPIRPGIVRVKGKQRTDLGRVIFANSITMTPGTVTIAVVGEELQVHGITEVGLADLEDGEMNRRCAQLERGHL